MDSEIFTDSDLSLKFNKKALAASLAIILVALLVLVPVFFMSAASYSSGYSSNQKASVQDFTWLVFPLFFVAGIFVTIIAKKFVSLSKSDFGLAMSMAGTLLIFIAVLLLLFITPFLQNIGKGDFLTSLRNDWLIRLAIFGIVGIVFSLIGNKLNSGRTPLAATLSFVAVPTIFLSAVFLLGLGIRDLITYKMPGWAKIPLAFEERFGWALTFVLLAVFTAAGVLYLWKAHGQKALVSFKYSVKIAGWIFVGLSLLLFIIAIIFSSFAKFNLDTFIHSILEPISYAIIGGLCLFGFEMLKINKKDFRRSSKS